MSTGSRPAGARRPRRAASSRSASTSPMVGRDAELAALLELFQVVARRPRPRRVRRSASRASASSRLLAELSADGATGDGAERDAGSRAAASRTAGRCRTTCSSTSCARCSALAAGRGSTALPRDALDDRLDGPCSATRPPTSLPYLAHLLALPLSPGRAGSASQSDPAVLQGRYVAAIAPRRRGLRARERRSSSSARTSTGPIRRRSRRSSQLLPLADAAADAARRRRSRRDPTRPAGGSWARRARRCSATR